MNDEESAIGLKGHLEPPLDPKNWLDPRNWPKREDDEAIIDKFLARFDENKPQPGTNAHRDDCEWVPIRWLGVDAKVLFRPRPERITEPSVGVERYAAGARHPPHWHDFAQVWYILKGEFRIGGKMYGPGSAIFYPDPHYEADLYTEAGGELLYVQYQGPTTRGLPVANGMGALCSNCGEYTVIKRQELNYCNSCGFEGSPCADIPEKIGK